MSKQETIMLKVLQSEIKVVQAFDVMPIQTGDLQGKCDKWQKRSLAA